MRSVLFLVGFVVGIGGALILFACVATAAASSVAWVAGLIVGQRTKIKEQERREQGFVDRRARVLADRRARARVASPSL
jgi:hypothetical protein